MEQQEFCFKKGYVNEFFMLFLKAFYGFNKNVIVFSGNHIIINKVNVTSFCKCLF